MFVLLACVCSTLFFIIVNAVMNEILRCVAGVILKDVMVCFVHFPTSNSTADCHC